MVEKGKQVPNWTIETGDGRTVSLWDFRQRSHVVLVWDPEAKADQVKAVEKAIEARRGHWDWLNAVFLFAVKVPPEAAPGVYVIDRYARLWNFLPAGGWTLEQIENDLIYYEARHC